jgi:hypothetical protein
MLFLYITGFRRPRPKKERQRDNYIESIYLYTIQSNPNGEIILGNPPNKGSL